MTLSNGKKIYRVTSTSGNTWQFENFMDAEDFIDGRGTLHHGYLVDELEIQLNSVRRFWRAEGEKNLNEISLSPLTYPSPSPHNRNRTRPVAGFTLHQDADESPRNQAPGS